MCDLVQTVITPRGANLISRRLIVHHGACRFSFPLILTISQHDAFADMQSSHRSLFTCCLISISNEQNRNNCNSCKRYNPGNKIPISRVQSASAFIPVIRNLNYLSDSRLFIRLTRKQWQDVSRDRFHMRRMEERDLFYSKNSARLFSSRYKLPERKDIRYFRERMLR